MDRARAVLRRHFGYDEFRRGQVDIIASVLGGIDTLAVLPTGGGKSLCYQVPALVLPRLTIVISPLISLMKDQVDRLVGRGIAAAYLNSTLDESETSSRLRSVARGDMKLLYLSPERFASPDLRDPVEQGGLSLIAVDEAHCISEWGHDFRPSFRRIADVMQAYGSPQVVALTATATPAVRRDIVRQLRMRSARVIVGGFDRSNLHYAVHRCRDDANKTRTLLAIMRSHARPAVVYAPTRASVTSLSKQLNRARCRAAPYHAGLDERQRTDTQEAFMRGRIDVIVATNAFGMGVDKSDVRLVVHYAMPRTLEAYYQEAGRAGRDGLPARCVLLHANADRRTHEWFIDATFPSRSEVEAAYSQRSLVQSGDRVSSRADPALAFLVRHGAVIERLPVGRLVRVLVTAAPDRIQESLSSPDDARHLAVVRALWRQGPGARQWERTVDLRALSRTIPWKSARATLEHLRDRRLLSFIAVDGGFLPARPDVPLDRLEIDWDAIARRRVAELAKLEMMEQYARTGDCRRTFVLAYFGERRHPETCAGCDNCGRTWRLRLPGRLAPKCFK